MTFGASPPLELPCLFLIGLPLVLPRLRYGYMIMWLAAITIFYEAYLFGGGAVASKLGDEPIWLVVWGVIGAVVGIMVGLGQLLIISTVNPSPKIGWQTTRLTILLKGAICAASGALGLIVGSKVGQAVAWKAQIDAETQLTSFDGDISSMWTVIACATVTALVTGAILSIMVNQRENGSKQTSSG